MISRQKKYLAGSVISFSTQHVSGHLVQCHATLIVINSIMEHANRMDFYVLLSGRLGYMILQELHDIQITGLVRLTYLLVHVRYVYDWTG